ncbi:hypothetical protein FHX08_005046 [Rhizobium sp. BK529]|nr:hypothetical protein [Rhizobium sp. BK529]TCS02383.1 hypothetical protein EV281_105340 [Rhizobium sp. BK418]
MPIAVLVLDTNPAGQAVIKRSDSHFAGPSDEFREVDGIGFITRHEPRDDPRQGPDFWNSDEKGWHRSQERRQGQPNGSCYRLKNEAV